MSSFFEFINIKISDQLYTVKWIEGDPDYIEKKFEKFVIYKYKDSYQFFDFDDIVEEIKKENFNCEKILNIVNLLSDFGINTQKFLSDKTYNKLFWGSNLPVVTPENKEYIPIWSEKERKEINKCLNQMKVLEKYL